MSAMKGLLPVISGCGIKFGVQPVRQCTIPQKGFDAGSDAEFIRFLKYARRSASEVQSQIYIALDRQYITSDHFQTIYDKATLLKKQINSFISYLKKSDSRLVE
jgi:23S rRNA-intervening sequence protein